MPIPKPRKGEGKKPFISRCMGDSMMNSEYPENDQRYAVCNTQWKNRNKKDLNMNSLKKTILATKEEFKKFFGQVKCNDNLIESLKDFFGDDFDEFKTQCTFSKENVEEKKDGTLIVKGLACTNHQDRVDDIITDDAMRGAAKQLLEPGTNTSFFNHDTDRPIGKVIKRRYAG